MPKILISAGDFSADIHGEKLIREMRKINPSLRVAALGGVKIKKVADEFLKDMVDLDVSGFSQPVKQFFNLKSILQQIIFPRLVPDKIDAVILIDYYGFNIHVAAKARENGVPVYYFVSPQVWASRRWRVNRLKKNVNKMLVIFPFEETLYREAGVPVEFVGHPLMEEITQAPEWKNTLNGKGNDAVIKLGLMPGSRVRELIRHIPTMLEACSRLKEKFPNLEVKLFAVEAIPESVYRELIGETQAKLKVPIEPELIHSTDYAHRTELTLCLTASGTATLENALLGIPMVVIYQTSWLTYHVAKRLIQVPYISMANILSGKKVVPELIQNDANPARVAAQIGEYLADPRLLVSMHGELIELRRKLGAPGAYKRAAESILASLSQTKPS